MEEELKLNWDKFLVGMALTLVIGLGVADFMVWAIPIRGTALAWIVVSVMYFCVFVPLTVLSIAWSLEEKKAK
jgi:hypothetical protein